MWRLDHTMIFVAIAASYTLFALLMFDGALSQVILALLWALVVAGGILSIVWPDRPTMAHRRGLRAAVPRSLPQRVPAS